MKITYIVDHLYSDGAGTENQVMKLVHGLSARHEVELITLRSTPWIEHQKPTLPCAVRIFELGKVRSPQFWGGLRALQAHLHRTAPDVVHTFFPAANIFAVLCAHRAGIGTIVASRRDYGHWMSGRYVAATRYANRYLRGIVTNSAQVKELTVRKEGFEVGRIAVIPNGVDAGAMHRDRPDLALKAKLGMPDDAVVLGLVANFRPIKRQDTLVRVLHLLLPTRPNLRILFVGGDSEDEPARDSVLALARSLGVDAQVHCAQARGNVADFLSIMDVGTNCSESEGLSNAIVEYMCAGVPCVVSDGGGNRDLVQPEKTGLLFPVGDVAGMAVQVERILDNAALRAHCVEEALSFVHREMNLDAVLGRFEKQYEDWRLTPLAPQAQRTARQRLNRLVKATAIRGMSTPMAAAVGRGLAPRNAATVLMYHEIGADDSQADVWQVVRESDFLRQVESLRRRYDLVTLDEAADHVAGKRRSDRPVAVLTFDDGDRGNFERLLPIVQREAFPITAYIATAHIENSRGYWFDRIVNRLQCDDVTTLDLRAHGLGEFTFNDRHGAENWARIQRLLTAIKALPASQCDLLADEIERRLPAPRAEPLLPMTPAQITELARCPYVTIGSHTHGHEVLTLLSLDEARASIERAQELLSSWIGYRPKHFSFPGGFHNAGLEALVREMGFSTAMGGGQGVWKEPESAFTIPRLAVGRYDTQRRFDLALDWGHLSRLLNQAGRAMGWGAGASLYPWHDLL